MKVKILNEQNRNVPTAVQLTYEYGGYANSITFPIEEAFEIEKAIALYEARCDIREFLMQAPDDLEAFNFEGNKIPVSRILRSELLLDETAEHLMRMSGFGNYSDTAECYEDIVIAAIRKTMRKHSGHIKHKEARGN